MFGRQPALLTANDLRGGVSQCQRCLTRRAGCRAASGSLPSKRVRALPRWRGAPIVCRRQARA